MKRIRSWVTDAHITEMPAGTRFLVAVLDRVWRVLHFDWESPYRRPRLAEVAGKFRVPVFGLADNFLGLEPLYWRYVRKEKEVTVLIVAFRNAPLDLPGGALWFETKANDAKSHPTGFLPTTIKEVVAQSAAAIGPPRHRATVSFRQ